MRLIVDIGHPAHVHFFRNFILEMRTRGHDILVTAGRKEMTLELLEAYGIDYVFTSKRYRGILGLAYELVKRDIQMLRLALKFKPDIITGISNPIVAHVARVTGAKSVVFTDSDHARLANMATIPFADVVCTPSCYRGDLGGKHVRYSGYHELAYLHPKYFVPDPSVLGRSGLAEGEPFVVVRFVAWQASHDAGQHGFGPSAKRRLIRELEQHARVFVTSEQPLPSELEKYCLMVPPEMLHDLLYYATLCVSDGATVTIEAAVLGTPAIRCASIVGPNDCGNLTELEEKYDLVYSFREEQQAIQKALELIGRPGVKQQWKEKRRRMIDETVDVTGFMVDLLENRVGV